MKYRSTALLTLAHTATDINQGAIPVLLPFFIAQHNLTYAAAAVIVFTTTFVSTITQPVFGVVADRLSRPWLMPFGVLLAGLGLSCVGLAPTYKTGLIAVALSGIGVKLLIRKGLVCNDLRRQEGYNNEHLCHTGQLDCYLSLIATFALLK